MSDENLFDFFLNWLDADRRQAEIKYEDIRRRLITLLEIRGCTPAEDLASEAIIRFVQRLPAIIEATPKADPYLYTVAHNIYIDTLDDQFFPLPDDISERPQPRGDADEEEERLNKCLDGCLDELEAGTRRLVLAYYRWDKRTKKRFRKKVAKLLGISANALSLRVFKARRVLEACIEDCMGLHSTRK